MEQTIRRIREKLLAGGPKGLNYDVYHVDKSGSADHVLELAQTLPFMASRRLVLVRDIDKMPADQLDRFIPYLKDPNPSTCLIFTAQKINKRSAFFRAFQKAGTLLHCPPLKEGELRQWIRKKASARGVHLDQQTIDYLIQSQSEQLRTLDNELEKILLLAAGTKTVSFDDVKPLISGGGIDTIFKLVEAIGHRNRTKALVTLKRLLDSGEPPLRILYMIARQIRMIWRLKELREQGLKGQSLMKELGVVSFQLDKFKSQSKNFSKESLSQALNKLAEADWALKSSSIKKRILLERLIIDLCQGG